MRKTILSLVIFMAVAAAGRAQSANHYVVPLSKPGQPVLLQVGLVSGGIVVESHGRDEVITERTEGTTRDESTEDEGR